VCLEQILVPPPTNSSATTDSASTSETLGSVKLTPFIGRSDRDRAFPRVSMAAVPASRRDRPPFGRPALLQVRGEVLHRLPKEPGHRTAGQRCAQAREQPRLERERPADARPFSSLQEFEQLDLRLREWHRGAENRPSPPRRFLPGNKLL